MVGFSSFQGLLSFVQVHGYWIFFVLVLALGPVAVIAAAFAASFRIFDVYFVFLVAFLASCAGDLFWYFLGDFGRTSFIDKHFNKLMKNKTLVKVEKLLEKDSFRAILLIKMIPPLPAPGLIFAGMDRLNFRKFLFASLVINIASNATFVALGYYFGVVIGRLFFSPVETFVGVFVLLSLVFVFHRKFSSKFYMKNKN